MKEFQKIDLGTIKIHRNVLADIVQTAIQEIKGVSLIEKDLWGSILGFAATHHYPGIIISADKQNKVSIEVKIVIAYGVNISEIAKQTQDVIREAIDRMANIDLKDINVNIQGIERREK